MADKETVIITWSEELIRYSDLEFTDNNYLDKTGFYSILSGIYNPRKRNPG